MAMLVGVRILVVEDEALVALMVEDALRDAGAEVLCAYTVEEALRLLGGEEGAGLDAAVLDLSLAGEGAAPVAEALRKRGIPFLIATGYGDAQQNAAGGATAGAPVLCKPFEPEALVATIATLVAPDRQPLRTGT
ncbi:response regulator [Caldovatus sediminis]|uniref:Response regulator n=2 Tax=Caldovatus sediminis TaxID=2041189 RepID=A0A8J2ZDC4_9PROT|nr:response regulator [Caldovatus sediminis]